MRQKYRVDKIDPSSFWQAWELAAICNAVSTSLEIYSEDSFRDGEARVPIFSRTTEGRSIATIRLILVESDLVFTEDDYTGHYMIIKRFSTICEKCDRELAEYGKHHVCKFPCIHCGEIFGGSMKHICPILIQNARTRTAEFLDGDGTAGINASLVEEVDLIMDDGVDDTDVIQRWRTRVVGGGVSFLAGDAGTGKTFQIDRLVREGVNNFNDGETHPDELIIDGKSVAIICPEAVACDNYRSPGEDGYTLKDLGVTVSTIHSFLSLHLGVKPQKRAELILEAKSEGLLEIRERIRAIDMIVVDEIGSSSTYLFSVLDQMLRIIRDCNLPFGGVTHLIMCGDFRQRPGYNEVSNAESYKRVPIFMSELWTKMNIQTYTLLQQRRVVNLDSEDEKRFIKCQMLMSRGVLAWRQLSWLNDQCADYVSKCGDPDVVHLMMSNKSVYETGHDCIKHFYPRAEIREYPILAGEVEVKDVGLVVQTGKLTSLRRTYDEVLMIAVGAPVMFTTNRYLKSDGEMANGSVGVVSKMEDDAITVSVRGGLHSVVVQRETVTSEIGKQFPLRLAYARTIHKSQGATMSKVCVYPSKRFIPECKNGSNVALMYVAISRVKSITGLSLSHRIENYHITVCARSVWYMKLIQTHTHSEVMGILKRCFNKESMDESPYMLYPFNMRSVDQFVSIPSKKVVDMKAGMRMYSRDELKEIADKPAADRTWWELHPYLPCLCQCGPDNRVCRN